MPAPATHDADSGGEMILLAALVSRVEALVTCSMLEAAGIDVYGGGLWHASVSVNSLALGGHRLYVPSHQYDEASQILREVLGDQRWQFCDGLRRAILRVLVLWVILPLASSFTVILLGLVSPAYILLIPLSVYSLPVNPQGRGDYYLSPARALPDQ